MGNQHVADAPCYAVNFVVSFLFCCTNLLSLFFVYNMSFLAAMASCSNLKRKILVLKEIEPPVREVVQGIPAASATLKKKVKKRGRTTNAALPIQDSSRERSNTAGADESSLINLSSDEIDHGAPKSGSNLMEQLCEQGSWLLSHSDALISAKVENISLQQLVSTNPPHIIAQRYFSNLG
uniref:Uncharacterized protein n=1 Tax=Cannabis sativa TaxID=3483 RepID=A0A803Q7M9_CANSA